MQKPTWPVITEADITRVLACLESGKLWLGDSGPYLPELEQRFRSLHGTQYALALTNGTHALEIALASLGIRFGDEVLVPAFTFIASAGAALMRNAFPIPVDIDPKTFCMDPAQIEARITERTKAVMPVHWSGHSCDMDAILKIARDRDLVVIEDCAQAHGARYWDRPVGSMGSCGTFSFQAGKAMTAGEGGMLVTNDPDLYEKAWSFSNCGRLRGEASTHYFRLASNCRMPEMLAALLVGQIDRLRVQTARRLEAVALLAELLADVEGIAPQGRREFALDMTYSLYMLRYQASAFGGLSRSAFMRELEAQGFAPLPGHPVFYRANYFASLYQDHPQLALSPGAPDYATLGCPVAEAVSAEVVWFRHGLLLSSDAELRRLVATIQEIQIKARRASPAVAEQHCEPASPAWSHAAKGHARIAGYKLYVFDLDGTLVSSKGLMVRALAHCNQLIERIEPPSYDRFFSMMGASLEEIFAELELPEFLVAEYRKYCRTRRQSVRVFAEVEEAVRGLVARDRLVALFTGKDRLSTLELLEHHGMSDLFHWVVACDDIEKGKPHPDGLELILDRLSVPRTEAVVIGDGLYDIESAHRAGVDGAFVLWGTGNEEDVAKLRPRWIYRTPKELKDALLGSRAMQA
jgi:HAD superfamily hydrolase (TIGR01509 family)